MAGLIEEMRERNATVQDAARELGRGLMRGNRGELKLGYSWENAEHAAAKMFELPKWDALELKVYLLGFATGITRSELALGEEQLAQLDEKSMRFREAFDAGVEAGGREDIRTVYPAGVESAAAAAERKRAEARAMKTCGCGATTKGECAAAVEGYFTSLGQRSEEQLQELAEGDECEAARVMLVERKQANGA